MLDASVTQILLEYSTTTAHDISLTALLPHFFSTPFQSVDEVEVEASAGAGSRVVPGFARKAANCKGKPKKAFKKRQKEHCSA